MNQDEMGKEVDKELPPDDGGPLARILELKREGKSVRAIGKELGLSKTKVQNYISRQRDIEKALEEGEERAAERRDIGEKLSFEPTDVAGVLPKADLRLMDEKAREAISAAATKRAQLQGAIDELRLEEARDEIENRKKLKNRSLEMDLEERDLKIQRKKLDPASDQAQALGEQIQELIQDRAQLNQDLSLLKQQEKFRELLAPLEARIEGLGRENTTGRGQWDFLDKVVGLVIPGAFLEIRGLRQDLGQLLGKANPGMKALSPSLQPISQREAEEIARKMEKESTVVTCQSCNRSSTIDLTTVPVGYNGGLCPICRSYIDLQPYLIKYERKDGGTIKVKEEASYE